MWPGLVVEENNLVVQVSALRKLLGPQAIATIPGRGYRFAASIDGDATAPIGSAVTAASRRNGASLLGLTNLPAQLLPLYGRGADVEAIRGELTSHTVVTLVGAGGMGKSRLAQAVAHEAIGRWPDGVWMVDCPASLRGVSAAQVVRWTNTT